MISVFIFCIGIHFSKVEICNTVKSSNLQWIKLVFKMSGFIPFLCSLLFGGGGGGSGRGV
jgi:hypothetical protein